MTEDLHSRMTQVEYRVSQVEKAVNATTEEMRDRSHDMADKVQEVIGDIGKHQLIISYIKERLDQIGTAVTGHTGGFSKFQGGIIALSTLITVLSLVVAVYAVIK